MTRNADEINKILTVVYNNEVNAFIRAAYSIMPEKMKRTILQNLTDLYLDLTTYTSDEKRSARDLIKLNRPDAQLPIIQSEFGLEDQNSMKREQILYYLGRLLVEDAAKILRFAFYHENASLLKRIAAIGGMLLDDYDLEKAYIETLQPGSEPDIENRSVQMLYFHDADGEFGEYIDDCEKSWFKTKNAIISRLKKSEIRELRLRWWDLRTLYLFCKSRHWDKQLNPDDINVIQLCTIGEGQLNAEKVTRITEEKTKITEKYLNK